MQWRPRGSSRSQALPCDLINGILQNKVPEHLVHSIVKGAVEAERQFTFDALPCDLIYGILQNKVPEHLVPSIVTGAVEVSVSRCLCRSCAFSLGARMLAFRLCFSSVCVALRGDYSNGEFGPVCRGAEFCESLGSLA